ncbi:hypothetical protein DFQ29_009988 [Apophysomyces sp. BC1021]|nr:hypothetical protein DFQ29_009988 [Apophysomyces sp. BC1021]
MATTTTIMKRKRRRVTPLPGLLPVVGELPDEKQDELEDHCPVTIKTCIGWVRGVQQDRIWIRVEACNTLSTVLFAAFTCLPDVFWPDLQKTLRVTCRYTYDQTEWSSSLSEAVQWNNSQDDLSWFQDDTCNVNSLPTLDVSSAYTANYVVMILAPLFYPSRVRLTCPVSADLLIKQGLQQILHRDNVFTRVYMSKDQELMIITDKDTLSLYGLTSRGIAWCIKKLQDIGCDVGLSSTPENEQQLMQDLLLGLHDETQYLGMPLSAENNRSVLAARQNTVELLSRIVQR